MRGGVEELPINEIEVVAFEEEEEEAGGFGPYAIDVWIDGMLDQYGTDEEEEAGGVGPYAIDVWIDEMLDQYESDEKFDSDCAFVAEHEGEYFIALDIDDYNEFILEKQSHFPFVKS